MMNSDEFHDLIDRHGVNPQRWPAARRDAALRYADTLGDTLRATLAPSRLLDALLDVADAPSPSETLRHRVLDSFPHRPSRCIGRHPWWSGAGLVGIAATGCIVGFALMSMLMDAPSAPHLAQDSLNCASNFHEDTVDSHNYIKENE